jgi:hypothetical protein
MIEKSDTCNYKNLKLAHVTLKKHTMKVVTVRTTTMKF